MDFTQETTTRHEYKLKFWLISVNALLGLLFIAFGGFFLTLNRQPSDRVPSMICALLFAAGGVYMLLRILNTRLILDGTRLELRTPFRSRSADQNEMEGFRTISTRNGAFLQIHLKNSKKISIPKTFREDDFWRAWFAQITDLDQKDCEKILEEVSNAPELGATTEERLATLKRAKRLNGILSGVCILIAIVLNFAHGQLETIAIFLSLLAPLLGIYLLLQSPLLCTIFRKKADPRAEAILILLAPSLGLMIYANTFTVLHAEKLALWALPIVLAFFALLFRQAKQGVAPVGSILGVLFFACCYGFGSVRAVDHLPTHAPAQFYSAAIVDKHETSGRSSSYYLHLAPWGPFQDENKLEVNHSLYEAAEIGDKICLELHQGLLHAPWYVPASCSKIPAQEQ